MASGSAAAPLRWVSVEGMPACEELVLVVPAAMLSWHSLTLPKLPAGRWLTALQGLLEDRLLTDTSATHLALAPGATTGQDILVAACDKAWLTQTLQSLERADRRPARIVPEFEPDHSGIHLLGQPERGWLVHCGPAQVQCLPLPCEARPFLQSWRQLNADASVRAEPGWAALADDLWGPGHVVAQPSAHLQRAAASAWNLAQFDLASRTSLTGKMAQRARQWWSAPEGKPVRWGLASLIALQVLGLQAWAWKQEHRLEGLQSDIRTTFTQAFAQVPVIMDPVLQMERETQALIKASGKATQGELAHMLAALATVGTAPEGIEFKKGELSLMGWQPAGASLPALQAGLERQGYRLQQTGERWTLRSAQPGVAP
jgi:general secretion pathway protein L